MRGVLGTGRSATASYAGRMTADDEETIGFEVRPARTGDVAGIYALMRPYAEQNILLGKDLVVLYEAVQEFVVAVTPSGEVVGCGAVHVLWRDLGEIRSIATAQAHQGLGIGHRVLDALVVRAKELGLSRLFCLTFETAFFARHGFVPVGEHLVASDVYAQMLRSPDVGVAEFLDLPWAKPNTLGNTRMLLHL